MTNFYKIIAYTDGACSNNGTLNSKGGWAYIIQFDNGKKEIHSAGYVDGTTNQRMELTAFIEVLKEIKIRWPDINDSVIVLSDSQYVVKGSSEWMYKWEKNGWKKSKNSLSDVANKDLWKMTFKLVKEIQPTVCWIKDHAEHTFNEQCDNLATTAVKMRANYYKVFRIPKLN